jgi:hypothetical protein
MRSGDAYVVDSCACCIVEGNAIKVGPARPDFVQILPISSGAVPFPGVPVAREFRGFFVFFGAVSGTVALELTAKSVGEEEQGRAHERSQVLRPEKGAEIAHPCPSGGPARAHPHCTTWARHRPQPGKKFPGLNSGQTFSRAAPRRLKLAAREGGRVVGTEP